MNMIKFRGWQGDLKQPGTKSNSIQVVGQQDPRYTWAFHSCKYMLDLF